MPNNSAKGHPGAGGRDPMAPTTQGRPVVVLGQGFAGPSRAGGPSLTLESRLCARAAARLLTEGRAPRLIFSGGRTAGPDHPSEAEAMWRCARRHAPVEATPRVRLEELSIDTVDNARHVSALLGAGEVVLVAPAAHLRRAIHHFRRHGLPVHEAWEAEALVEQVSRRHARLIRAYRGSARAMTRRLKEKILFTLLAVDPGGLLPGAVTRYTRHGRTAVRRG
jgi:uncharacterized SAM-binding protein YcdF (DUF218 family)